MVMARWTARMELHTRFSTSTLCFNLILLNLFTAFSEVNKLSRETPFGPRSPLNLSPLEFFATLLPVLLISLLVHLSLIQRVLPRDFCFYLLLSSRSFIHLSSLTRTSCLETSYFSSFYYSRCEFST